MEQKEFEKYHSICQAFIHKIFISPKYIPVGFEPLDLITAIILYLKDNGIEFTETNFRKYLPKVFNKIVYDYIKSKPYVWDDRQNKIKKWKLENKDRVKMHQTKWNEKNKERKSAKEKEWREKNKDKRYKQSNSPKIKSENYAEKNREGQKRFRERNPERHKEIQDAKNKKITNDMTDGYIKMLLRQKGFTNEEISNNPSLIENKRQEVLLKRLQNTIKELDGKLF